MKFKFILRPLVIVLSAFVLTNCSKKDSTTPPPAPADTKLQLTIKDNLGNPSVGATVILYSSLTDYQNDVNRVTLMIADFNGVVTFPNLSAIKYYWSAKNGCQTNIFGSATTASPIAAHMTTTATTVLDGAGELKFVNTSSNPYRVFINGTAYADMNGGTTKTVNYAAVGAYTIRILQLSGYAISPTDKTYTGNVVCGGVLTTTFP